MKEWFTKVWAGVQNVWKAIGAGVIAGVSFVWAAGIFALDKPPVEAMFAAWGELANWSTGQWFGLVAAIAAAYGVVWSVPNKPKA